MRHIMIKRHSLLDDMLTVMKMDIGQSLRSNDVGKMYMVVRKWEAILAGSTPIKTRRR